MSLRQFRWPYCKFGLGVVAYKILARTISGADPDRVSGVLNGNFDVF